MHSKRAPSTPKSRNPSKQSRQHCCKWRHKKEAALQKMDQDLLGRTRGALSFVFLFSLFRLCLCICCQKRPLHSRKQVGIFWKDFPSGLSIDFVFVFFSFFNTWELLRDSQDDCTLEERDLLLLDILFYFTSVFD